MDKKQQALVVNAESEIDGWVAGWLHEKQGRTGSKKTAKAYEETIASFRDALRASQLTLMGPPPKVAIVAQAWAAFPNKKTRTPVSNNTHNVRLAIISSFYHYLIRSYPEVNIINPIERVKRRPVQEYAAARALEKEQVRKALAQIDRASLAGKRDYALLSMALTTGRRASELAEVRRYDLALQKGELTVFFRRCKGAKQMMDTLDATVSLAVMRWIQAYYGGLEKMPAQAPLWCNLSSQSREKPLTIQAISLICQKYLGTSKVHVTRHTFAHSMENAGAKISEIAAKLGHSNPTVTGRYLAALSSNENPYAGELANEFGIE